MNSMTTSEIAAVLGTTVDQDKVVTSIVIDTRKVCKGCLFVCIKGENFDGNDFADEAIRLGATAVLCNNSAKCQGTAIRVEDTRKAFLCLSSYYRTKFNIPVVALTGSVGKTTTKEMIFLVLSGKFNAMKTQGNFNNEIGLPQTLFRLEDGVDAAVIEMGMSHFGEISELSKATKATVGLITNIGLSHIENLGSQEGIFKAKMEILDGLQDGAPLIVNGDDKFLGSVSSTSQHKLYKYGLENADFKGYNIKEEEGSTSFLISFFGKTQEVTVPTIGVHNVYNALAAFSVGYVLGIAPEKMAESLANYVPEGMRQKCVKINGILSIEDCYNASPDSMKASISTLVNTKGNRKFAVLSDMLELGDYSKEAHLQVGKMVGDAKVDVLFAYGNYAKEYITGASENGFTKCAFFDDKMQVADALANEMEQGDVVVFKASRGMKLEEVILSFYDKWGNK